MMLQLDALVHRHARFRPGAPAVTFEEQTLDWGAFEARVNRVVIHDDFPRSAAGETLKRELREPCWAASEGRI